MKKNMLSAVLYDFNDLRLESVSVPEPGPDEVVVKVKACGFCATDYKAIKGIRRNVSFPCIVGHEPSGIVSAVGQHVTHLKEGDEVVVMPSCYCGHCKYCRAGKTHYCEHAWTAGGDGPQDVRPGAFAEYMKIGSASIFAKPANISFEAAALTEPLSGAWKGVIQHSEMEVGDDVVIIGVGSIGLLCMMVAKVAGAGSLIAVDTSDYALRNALALGATHAVNPRKGDARKLVYDIIPDGPDLVIEASGAIQAVQLMVDLRRRGTKWNVFGITTHEKFELDGGLTHFLEGRQDASFGSTPLAMLKALRLMEKGLVNPEKIISHRFPLGDIHKAVETFDSEERNKVIIMP